MIHLRDLSAGYLMITDGVFIRERDMGSLQ